MLFAPDYKFSQQNLIIILASKRFGVKAARLIITGRIIPSVGALMRH
jgi:hypothetical protein